MASLLRFCKRLPLFTLCAGIGLAIGCIVPTVFEWGQRPASRSRHPQLEWAALGVMTLTLIASFLIVWLRGDRQGQLVVSNRPGTLRFGLRRVFVVMTLVAVVLAVALRLKMPWANGLVAALALGIAGWSFRYDWSVRSRTAAFLASMFLPFVWMIAYNRPFGHTTGLLINLPIAPAHLPAAFLQSLIAGATRDDSARIAVVLVVLELILGAGLAQRGGKLSVAFIILVLAFSSLSSLLTHVVYRV